MVNSTKNITLSTTNIQMADVIRELTEGIQAQINMSNGLDRKKTEVLVEDKTAKQMAAIKAGIIGISPKFSPKTRGYAGIKEKTLATTSSYESTLRDFAGLYDSKLSKLHIDLAGLYGKLIGEMANSQYLKEQVRKRKESAENSSTKVKFLDRIKKAIATIGKAKDEKDVSAILKAQDEKEIAEELSAKQEEILTNEVDNANAEKQASSTSIDKTLQDILSVKKHIEMIRGKKEKGIQNAMESEEKGISKNIRRPRAISRFTRFIISKINLASVVENSVLAPVSLRIAEFRNNELVDTALALSDTEGEATIKEEQEETFGRKVVNAIKSNLAPYLTQIEEIKDMAKEEQKLAETQRAAEQPQQEDNQELGNQQSEESAIGD